MTNRFRPTSGTRVAASAAAAVLLLGACSDLKFPAFPGFGQPADAGVRTGRAPASATAATPLEVGARRRAPPPPAPAASAVAEAPLAPPATAPATAAPQAPVVAAAPQAPAAASAQVAAAPAARASRWQIRQGTTLRQTLEDWAANAPCASAPSRSWTVVWKSRRTHPIEAGHDLDASLDFASAADQLLALYARNAAPPVAWSVWTGNCALVVGDRPDGEGNEDQ